MDTTLHPDRMDIISRFSTRAFIALICLILTGCTKACREWGFQANISSCKTYTAGRIFLEPENEYGNLEIEIVRTHSGVRFYLNILFLQALPCAEDPSKTEVEIFFDDEEDPLIIYPLILRGGQRLLFTQEFSNYLIQVLCEGQSFDVKVGKYRIRAIAETFAKQYDALMKIDIEERSLI